MTALIRVLTREEALHKYNDCCWSTPRSDLSNCVRVPLFRLATPHGEMDFCREHIDYAIASLPPEWLAGFAYREPVLMETGDDIPF